VTLDITIHAWRSSWVVPNRCGPFSALEGIGGGQKVQEAEDPAGDPTCQHSF
jgi:hypothetical protein